MQARPKLLRLLIKVSNSDRNHYENKCVALDRQIDALVYELYELTPAEIALVENS
jgi:hypothetical protein